MQPKVSASFVNFDGSAVYNNPFVRLCFSEWKIAEVRL